MCLRVDELANMRSISADENKQMEFGCARCVRSVRRPVGVAETRARPGGEYLWLGSASQTSDSHEDLCHRQLLSGAACTHLLDKLMPSRQGRTRPGHSQLRSTRSWRSQF